MRAIVWAYTRALKLTNRSHASQSQSLWREPGLAKRLAVAAFYRLLKFDNLFADRTDIAVATLAERWRGAPHWPDRWTGFRFQSLMKHRFPPCFVVVTAFCRPPGTDCNRFATSKLQKTCRPAIRRRNFLPYDGIIAGCASQRHAIRRRGRPPSVAGPPQVGRELRPAVDCSL